MRGAILAPLSRHCVAAPWCNPAPDCAGHWVKRPHYLRRRWLSLRLRVVRIQDDPNLVKTIGQLGEQTLVLHSLPERSLASGDHLSAPGPAWLGKALTGLRRRRLELQELEQQLLGLGRKPLDLIEKEAASIEAGQEPRGLISLDP